MERLAFYYLSHRTSQQCFDGIFDGVFWTAIFAVASAPSDKVYKFSLSAHLSHSDTGDIYNQQKDVNVYWKKSTSKSMDDDFLQDLFIDLSDPIRRQIISTLYSTNSKQQSDLKEILDVNDQELGRNLKRLEERSLIEVTRHSGRPGINEDRKSGNEVSLSALGQWLYPQLSAITVFDKHRQYFVDHSPFHLPPAFRQKINIILNSPFQIVEGYTNVCQKWIEMYRNTDHGQYIHAAKSQVSLNMIYESFEAIYFRNVKYRYILQKNFRGSKDRREKLKRLRWEKLIHEGRIERGMLEDIPVVVILNEKEAAISFPKEGKADIDKCLYSKDPLFHQWCEEYFEYLWKDCLIFRDEWIIEEGE